MKRGSLECRSESLLRLRLHIDRLRVVSVTIGTSGSVIVGEGNDDGVRLGGSRELT